MDGLGIYRTTILLKVGNNGSAPAFSRLRKSGYCRADLLLPRMACTIFCKLVNAVSQSAGSG